MWGAHWSILPITGPAGPPHCGWVVCNPEDSLLWVPLTFFFFICFPSSPGQQDAWMGGHGWGRGRDLWGLRRTKGPGVGSDAGDVGWALDRWVDTQSWHCAGALDGWGFPRWPLGISALSPTFQRLQPPFRCHLTPVGPSPASLPLLQPWAGARWASPVRNFSWGYSG